MTCVITVCGNRMWKPYVMCVSVCEFVCVRVCGTGGGDSGCVCGRGDSGGHEEGDCGGGLN